MNRREFLKRATADTFWLASTADLLVKTEDRAFAAGEVIAKPFIDPATAKDWLARWEKNILAETHNRYCDKEMGEELGWLVSPFLNGFHHGYLATSDPKWVEMLVDWTDSCLKRGVKEPDGFIGWPKGDGGGNDSSEYAADSILGEAMLLRPVVMMADLMVKTPVLEAKWGAKARGYLEFATQTFKKWDSRSCWRQVRGGGGVWVVPGFGIDKKTGGWSAGYEHRKAEGFSNPANKQNAIASFLIALHDATGQAVYRERAEAWWRLMRSRMTTRADGKYFVWNYWDPAGAWDYKANGATKHWVGVHPNGGYYEIDVSGMVTAFEHGLAFSREDMLRLIATNRDFMWNQHVENAEFQRIDGGAADSRWAKTPGVLWTSLAPYDETLRKIFMANHKPGSWGGLGATPWAVTRKVMGV